MSCSSLLSLTSTAAEEDPRDNTSHPINGVQAGNAARTSPPRPDRGSARRRRRQTACNDRINAYGFIACLMPRVDRPSAGLRPSRHTCGAYAQKPLTCRLFRRQRQGLPAQRTTACVCTADTASWTPPPAAPARARLAVFVSGGGSNFKAIHAACGDGRVNGDVVVRMAYRLIFVQLRHCSTCTSCIPSVTRRPL